MGLQSAWRQTCRPTISLKFAKRRFTSLNIQQPLLMKYITSSKVLTFRPPDSFMGETASGRPTEQDAVKLRCEREPLSSDKEKIATSSSSRRFHTRSTKRD